MTEVPEGLHLKETNIFKRAWKWYGNLDRFTRYYIITMLIIVILIPAIIEQQTYLSRAAINNLLLNASFDNYRHHELIDWNFILQPDQRATVTKDSANKIYGIASAMITVNTSSSSPDAIQLRQTGIILAPATYIFSFYAKADKNRTIEVTVRQTDNPANTYLLQSVGLSTYWTKTTITFTVPTADTNAEVNFNLAQTTGIVWLDSAILANPNATTPLAPAPTASILPTSIPTPTPTMPSTPTSIPTHTPTSIPTSVPTSIPTAVPTGAVSSGIRPISLVFYGTHTTSTDNSIIAAKPMFDIDNTPHGPWGGNCTASKFSAAGIKVFSYITAGYENGYSESIPNDLTSNLNYIDSIAANDTGTYGIFMDEVDSDPNNSPYPSSGAAFKWNYLQQISQEAHNKGLKLMCNTGENTWDDELMDDCDYLMSTEDYQGAALTASQSKWASRVVVLSEYVTDPSTAIEYTNKALSLGLLASYAGPYTGLPSWWTTYITGIPTD